MFSRHTRRKPIALTLFPALLIAVVLILLSLAFSAGHRIVAVARSREGDTEGIADDLEDIAVVRFNRLMKNRMMAR